MRRLLWQAPSESPNHACVAGGFHVWPPVSPPPTPPLPPSTPFSLNYFPPTIIDSLVIPSSPKHKDARPLTSSPSVSPSPSRSSPPNVAVVNHPAPSQPPLTYSLSLHPEMDCH